MVIQVQRWLQIERTSKAKAMMILKAPENREYLQEIRDSEFEGLFDSEEDREILEDVEYLEAVCNGWFPPDGNTRDDIFYGTLIYKLSLTTFSRPFMSQRNILNSATFGSLLDINQAASNT